MRSYSVAARGLGTVEVQATNWIIALGSGLERLGRANDIGRLACEVLPNGTVIARDISSGTGFIVQLANEARPDAPVVDDAIEAESEADHLSDIESSASPADACHHALAAAVAKIQAESGAVLLKNGKMLEFVAAMGPHEDDVRGLAFPADAGVAGYALQKRRSVVLGNAAEDPRHLADFDQRLGYNTKDLAVVPILAGDDVFGVIELLNLSGGRRFTREDVHDLQQIAQTLAVRLKALETPDLPADAISEADEADEEFVTDDE
jgi:GAF domain-containing protein